MWHLYPIAFLQGSQATTVEEEGESLQDPVVKEDFCETVPSGHTGAAAFINSQYLWLSTQDLTAQINQKFSMAKEGTQIFIPSRGGIGS